MFALVLDVLDLASLGSALLDLTGLGSGFAWQGLSLEDTPPQKKNGFKEA